MILTCPACATRYVIGDDVFQDGDREVRCAKCSHRWTSDGSEAVDEIDARTDMNRDRATPAPESPAPTVAREPVEAPAPDAGQVGFGLDDLPGMDNAAADGDAVGSLDDASPDIPDAIDPVEPEPRPLPDAGDGKKGRKKGAKPKGKPGKAKSAKQARLPRRRTPIWVWIGWLVLMLCIAGVAAALIFMRQPLTEAWPPLQRLYDTVGSVTGGGAGADHAGGADHAQPDHVELSVESSELTDDHGKRQLNILIRLTNTTAERQALPIAVVHLVRADGATEKSERIRLPSDQPLAPKESRVMALRLSDVPTGVVSVKAEAEAPEAH